MSFVYTKLLGRKVNGTFEKHPLAIEMTCLNPDFLGEIQTCIILAEKDLRCSCFRTYTAVAV